MAPPPPKGTHLHNQQTFSLLLWSARRTEKVAKLNSLGSLANRLV